MLVGHALYGIIKRELAQRKVNIEKESSAENFFYGISRIWATLLFSSGETSVCNHRK